MPGRSPHEIALLAAPLHLPTHASWLNQIEIYFSIIQREEPDRIRL